MNAEFERALTQCGTDLEGVRQRFAGDDALYETCLGAFLEDTTVAQLRQTLRAREWDEAFTAAHALKGVAGNMGFVPLLHATAQLVVVIRTGRLAELEAAFVRVDERYRQIIRTIKENRFEADNAHKGEPT